MYHEGRLLLELSWQRLWVRRVVFISFADTFSMKDFDSTSRIAAGTFHGIFDQFLDLMLEHYEEEFLSPPTEAELSEISEKQFKPRGFPFNVGSLDCSHLEWKKCPRVDHGSHQNKVI